MGFIIAPRKTMKLLIFGPLSGESRLADGRVQRSRVGGECSSNTAAVAVELGLALSCDPWGAFREQRGIQRHSDRDRDV